LIISSTALDKSLKKAEPRTVLGQVSNYDEMLDALGRMDRCRPDPNAEFERPTRAQWVPSYVAAANRSAAISANCAAGPITAR